MLLEVLCRGLLDRPIRPGRAEIGSSRAAMIRTPRVGGQEPARMRRPDFETREPVKRTLEDQMRESDGGLERITNHIVQIAVALETLIDLGRSPITLRVVKTIHPSP